MQEVASKRLANGFLVCLTNRERFVCMAVGRSFADNRKWTERPAAEIVCVGGPFESSPAISRIVFVLRSYSSSYADFSLPAKAAFVRDHNPIS
jgi:hypothetical protein